MQRLTRCVFNHLVKNALSKSIRISPSTVDQTYSDVFLQNYSTKSTKSTKDTKGKKDTKDTKATKGPAKQKLLQYPALPLEETLKKFMKSVQPLLNEREMEETAKAVQEFRNGPAKELQKMLEKVAKCEANWLTNRWQRVAYMQFRTPVTVYSSPGMSMPLQKFKDEEDYVKYTGKVLYGMAKYKQLIDKGQIPVVKLGKNELDNSQFGVVYGTCRIPEPSEDRSQLNLTSKHIAVIYKNHFYKLNLYNAKDVPLHPDTLAIELNKIMKAEKEKGVPFGILSTDNRDNWAAAYAELMKIPGNKESVTTIQKSMFTVSLDECVPIKDGDEFNTTSHQLLHGGGSEQNSGNRWMDKTLQLIVNPNGVNGWCYEHSPAEGQPVAVVADYVTLNMNNKKHFEGAATDDFECPQKLKLNCNEHLEKHLTTAQCNIDKLAKNLHVNVLHYDNYGKEFLKKQKLSPDSYIQMALQYAFYSLHKAPAAQYESAHLRIFVRGRTETIRSCSIESVAFAKAMTEGSCCDAELAELLRKAVDGHRAYTTMALQGRGVDRHLLGLKLMAIENQLPIPDFYKCPGFVKSAHFQVSTSQVASPSLAFMSYGPTADDGYACCYNPRDCDLILACTCWRDNKLTDADAFAESLCNALTRMHEVLSSGGDKPAAK